MDIHKYISNGRAIQEKILEYIEGKDNSDENFQKLIKLINDQKIKEDKHDSKSFYTFLRLFPITTIVISIFLKKYLK